MTQGQQTLDSSNLLASSQKKQSQVFEVATSYVIVWQKILKITVQVVVFHAAAGPSADHSHFALVVDKQPTNSKHYPSPYLFYVLSAALASTR